MEELKKPSQLKNETGPISVVPTKPLPASEIQKDNNFPIQPLMDRVFVKKDDMSVDQKTGFALPETVKGRAQTGTVVAVGPGYLDVLTGNFYPTSLKVGDRVFIKAFDGYIIRYEEHEFFVFSEKEILGKVK